MPDQPLVSIVIPVRDAAATIAQCMRGFLEQDYPRHSLEILVVDGRSTDSTRDEVRRTAEAHPDATVRLLDNPDRRTPHALNRGIRESRGEIIIIFGAHSRPAPDYVSRVVRVLEETGAGAAGGSWEVVGDTPTGKIIAAARASLIGGALSRHRYSTVAGPADTVRFAGYRREVFEKAGLFDPELVRNQDDEFNYRARLAGFVLYYDPSIRCTYHARSTFGALWRQLYDYGAWKPRVLQKNPAAFSLQFAIPPLFVASLLLFAGLGTLWRPLWAALALEAGAYLLLTAGFAAAVAAHRGPSFFPGVLLAYWIIHFAAGLGTLAGLGRLRAPRQAIPRLEAREAAHAR